MQVTQDRQWKVCLPRCWTPLEGLLHVCRYFAAVMTAQLHAVVARDVTVEGLPALLLEQAQELHVVAQTLRYMMTGSAPGLLLKAWLLLAQVR